MNQATRSTDFGALAPEELAEHWGRVRSDVYGTMDVIEEVSGGLNGLEALIGSTQDLHAVPVDGICTLLRLLHTKLENSAASVRHQAREYESLVSHLISNIQRAP